MRHTNRQCGPRGPNSNARTTEAQRRVNHRHYELREARLKRVDIIRAALIAFATLPLVAGCAGLTQMSDEWCARHPDATQARCQ